VIFGRNTAFFFETAAGCKIHSRMTPRGGVTQNKEDPLCPGIQNGPRLNIRRGPLTRSAAAFSRESFAKSVLPRASAAAKRTRTPGCERHLAVSCKHARRKCRAPILRGTGQLEGEQYEEATFEGYGPGGVGMLFQVVTTNRNRVVGEFRT